MKADKTGTPEAFHLERRNLMEKSAPGLFKVYLLAEKPKGKEWESATGRAAEEREDKKAEVHCTFSAGVSRFHPDAYPRIFCLAASDLVHSRSGNRRDCSPQIKVPPYHVPFCLLPSCLKASNPHFGKKSGKAHCRSPLLHPQLLTEETVSQLHQLIKVHVKTQNKITCS